MQSQSDGKYIWTHHSRMKMRYYQLSESRIKRVIRHPHRVEEGILPRAVAVMSTVEGKRYSEIWVMYILVPARGNSKLQNPRPGGARLAQNNWAANSKRLKIITAWRYPGRAPERDPVPAYILKEIKKLI